MPFVHAGDYRHIFFLDLCIVSFRGIKSMRSKTHRFQLVFLQKEIISFQQGMSSVVRWTDRVSRGWNFFWCNAYSVILCGQFLECSVWQHVHLVMWLPSPLTFVSYHLICHAQHLPRNWTLDCSQLSPSPWQILQCDWCLFSDQLAGFYQ